MTIATTGNSQTFPGNGATTVFTFTFVGGDTDWLSVIYTNASGTQTDVTGSGTLALNAATGGALWGVGGTFTYNPSGSPISSGTTLTITRTIPLTQLTSFANQNSVYNEVTEETFDTTVMQIQQVNANTLSIFAGTSTTSLTIGTGTQTLTVEEDLAFAPGMFVTIAYQAIPADFMQGIVTSYTASTGVLVVYVTSTSGSGTFASWYVGLSGGPAQGTVSLTGDVTGSGTTSIATTIANNAVSNAKLRQSAALTVVGRSANTTGNVADIAAVAASDSVLRESGSTVGFGTIATAGIANNAVTDAKLRQGAALTVIGNAANSTGNVADIAAGSDKQVLRRSGTALAFGAVDLTSTAAVTGALVANSFPALTGDVTTSAGSLATAIGANKVTDTMIRQSAGLSVIARSANTTGNVADVTAGSDLQVMRRSGTSIGFGSIDLSSSAAVTGVLAVANLPGIQTKTGLFTRDTTTASGTQAVTGVGFTPKACIFFCAVTNVGNAECFGFDNASTPICMRDQTNGGGGTFSFLVNNGGFSIDIFPNTLDGSKQYSGKINSMDADGFTIGWTKTGSPTGTIVVGYLAIR